MPLTQNDFDPILNLKHYNPSPRKWIDLFYNDNCLWAKVKSGGISNFTLFFKKNHHNKLEYYCNCGSSSQICKHSSSLVSHFINKPGEFEFQAKEPDFISEKLKLIKARPKISLNPINKENLLPSTFRQKQFHDASIDVLSYLQKVIQIGFGNLENQNTDFWKDFYQRLIDLKLPGIAAIVRQIIVDIKITDDSKKINLVVQHLGQIYLLVQGLRNAELLPPNMIYDLYSKAGYTIKKKDIISQEEKINDDWVVLGVLETKPKDNLFLKSIYLFGVNSRRYVQILDFAFGNQSYNTPLKVKDSFDGDVHFYPSVYPLRGVIDFNHHKNVSKYYLPVLDSFDSLSKEYANVLAIQPWLDVFPATLAEVQLKYDEDMNILWGVDILGKYLHFVCSEHNMWKLIALSGGRRINVFGVWRNAKFLLLSAFIDGLFHAVSNPPLERPRRNWE